MSLHQLFANYLGFMLLVKVKRFAGFPFRMEVECMHQQNVSFFHFWMMTPCDGIDCSRVRRSTEFDISSTKVWSLFSYQKV